MSCDSGTDSPGDFKKTAIDNPIEMDTSPLGAALGECGRRFYVTVIPGVLHQVVVSIRLCAIWI